MLVPEIGVYVCPMDYPSDMTALNRLLDDGTIDARDVVAVVGKTEGSGLGKDVGRELVDASVRALLAARAGADADRLNEDLCMILSGGSPGVISPHVTLFTRRWVPASQTAIGTPGRLTIGRASSVEILPEEIGRATQVEKVAEAVRRAIQDAGISKPEDIHAVMVKGPALTEAGIAAARERGNNPVTLDLSIGPEGAMCYSNDASALGVAVGTGEVSSGLVSDGVIRRNFDLYSDIAITSAAGEKDHAEVLVLGNHQDAAGNLRIGHQSMRDILDMGAVQGALLSAGLDVSIPVNERMRSRITYLLAKMIIPASDRLYGNRITLHDDPFGYHVAKAMGGYLLASTTGLTAVFVSGGEANSHQGPPEGNPLAAIVRLD
jgi:cyanuric acid amidohydrolase